MIDIAPHLSWLEVIRGSEWATPEDVPPALAAAETIFEFGGPEMAWAPTCWT